MNTTTSVIGRLETGGGKNHHSPTIETLRKYARALNCGLQIKFVRQNKNTPDLLLIYRKPDQHTLRLARMGSHSELFD